MPLYHTPAGPVEMLEWGDGEELWLLLHAAATGPYSLSRLAGSLQAPGRRIIAPALHGYGATRIEATGDRIDQHVAVARACLDVIPASRRVVFGHSMGGLVALLTAISGAPVDRLVLYEPIVMGCLCTDNPADMACRDWDREILHRFEALLEAGEAEAGVAAFVEAWNEVRWDQIPPPARARLVASAIDLATEVRAGSHRVLAPPDLAAIRADTLILQGGASPDITRRMTAGLVDAIPGARRLVLDAAGHMAPVQQPAAVTALL